MSSDKTDILTHAPLPYIVKARVVVSEDAPAESREVRLFAYSVLEAMMQASQELGGGFDDARVKVERIEPDVEGYLQMVGKLHAAGIVGTK